ncbi:MAG: hypothetical protein CL489_05125, partial [Acidobacteria bacterium]|nr:hypothetical protein [Acidobacteriota bacterium]
MVITAASVKLAAKIAAKLAAQRREKALRIRNKTKKIEREKHSKEINKIRSPKPIKQAKGISTGRQGKFASIVRMEQSVALLKQRKQQGLTLRKEPFQSLKPNFGKATPEQIALRKKKDARLAAIEARKKARRHRGGYKKTHAYAELKGKKKAGIAVTTT